MAIFPGSAIPSAISADIDNSCRFDPTAYLSRTPGSLGNRKVWTISVWVKRSGLGTGSSSSRKGIMGTAETGASGDAGERMIRLQFNENDYLGIVSDNPGDNEVWTSAKYRDPSAWYHVVVGCNTTETIASNRLKFYVNGEQVTSFSQSDYPLEDADTGFNYTHEQRVGWGYAGGAEPTDGYLAEAYFIDGLQYAASDFGELDSATNQWIPKDASSRG